MNAEDQVVRADADSLREDKCEESSDDSGEDRVDDDADGPLGAAMVNVRFEGHQIQLPLAMVESMPAPMLLELLRRRLGLQEPDVPE